MSTPPDFPLPRDTADPDPTEVSGGMWGGLTTAVFGEKVAEAQHQQAQRAAMRTEQLATIKVTDAASRSRHRGQMQAEAEREARARATQQWVVAWLIAGIGVEVLVFLPLLVWGLWTEAVFG